jgi:hypothetical protein
MKKPTAGFASGGGLETLLVLLAVSALAGSARSLNLNNGSGRGRRNSAHRPLGDQSGALRDGERQTHDKRITRTSEHASENRFVAQFVTTLLTLLSDAVRIPSTINTCSFIFVHRC